jgi:hypothetical protein
MRASRIGWGIGALLGMIGTVVSALSGTTKRASPAGRR